MLDVHSLYTGVQFYVQCQVNAVDIVDSKYPIEVVTQPITFGPPSPAENVWPESEADKQMVENKEKMSY